MRILDLQGYWQPSREFILEHLKTPRNMTIKLDTFPRGLDGARIDVSLGDSLELAISGLVQASLAKRMQMLQIAGTPTLTSGDASLAFRESYEKASLAAARRSRDTMRREIYRLFHLAVVKQILLVLDHQLDQWGSEGEGALQAADLSTGDHALRSEKLWLFRRYRARLRYLAAHDVLGILHSLDRVSRKRRKSILALSWPVPEELLFNPLLQLDDLRCEENFLELYPLVLMDPEQFRRMDQAMLSILGKWLPVCCDGSPPSLDGEELRSLPLRQDEGELSGYAQVEAFLRQVMSPREFLEGGISWLDQPRNLIRLLGGGQKGGGTGPWRHRRWPAYQEELVGRIERQLDQLNLLEPLLASLRLRDAYPDLGRRGAPRLLLDYLLGKRSRQEVASALERLDEVTHMPAYQNRLAELRKELRQASPLERRRWLLEALEGYARLRRDLKLAWEGYRAMDSFRLLRSGDDRDLSRANGLLQDFDPGARVSEQVRGHVIIKADLRGSTELIASMNQAGINPATYFSQNLFAPVNTLLNTYGAEKIFLEGDAVILSILDYPGQPGPVVARACGLAYDLISLVNERNRENRRLGLPQLELGVGIAYEHEAPTYLFDDGRKITISPAIHRADRLSSSNLPRDFLTLLHQEKPHGWGVEVVMLEESANPVSKEGELRRYNVNGVELDAAASSGCRGRWP
ncbi:MAG TPA: hypothetical protein EYP90_12280 [Chromatiaceae bacterium]|nr:hypothetical protein [Chromatiaceae bacterium]